MCIECTVFCSMFIGRYKLISINNMNLKHEFKLITRTEGSSFKYEPKKDTKKLEHTYRQNIFD